MSLRLRLLIGIVPLFIIGLIAANFAVYTNFQEFLISRVDLQLESGHPEVEAALQRGDTGNGGREPAGVVPGTYAKIIDSSGVIQGQVLNFLPSGINSQPNIPSQTLLIPTTGHTTFSVSGTGYYSNYRVYVEPVQGSSNLYLVEAIPIDEIYTTLHQLILIEIIVSSLITVLVGVAIWIAIKRGLRPLTQMGQDARNIAITDLSKRVTPANKQTEVGQLGLAINEMLAKLEEGVGQKEKNELRLRNFISDASHELRTPLTSMRGYAELLRRSNLDPEDEELATRRLAEETNRMSLLVDDLMLLTRLDQKRPLELKEVDLEKILLDVYEDAKISDPQRAITFNIHSPIKIMGDQMRLRQVFSNIMRNAIVHTPAGTPIELELTKNKDSAIVKMIDHGAGIPVADRPLIFGRFHRATPEKSRDQQGSGLGLSVVAGVVQAHHGEVEIVDTPNGGATFVIAMPLLES